MNDGMFLSSIISGFVITWGWLIKLSYTMGKIEQKLSDLSDSVTQKIEEW